MMRYFKTETEKVLQQLWAINETPEVNDSQHWNINHYTPKHELPLNWNALIEITPTEFYKLAQEYGVLSRKETIPPTGLTSAEEHPAS